MTNRTQGPKPSTPSARNIHAADAPPYLLKTYPKQRLHAAIKAAFRAHVGRDHLLTQITEEDLIEASCAGMFKGLHWLRQPFFDLPFELRPGFQGMVCVVRRAPEKANRWDPAPTPEVLVISPATPNLPPLDGLEPVSAAASAGNEVFAATIWRNWEAATAAGLTLDQWDAQQRAIGAKANAARRS